MDLGLNMSPQSLTMSYKSFTFKKNVAKPECISEILFRQVEMNFLYQKFEQSFCLLK